jgi:DNA-binding FrmR family transcriptional regulator
MSQKKVLELCCNDNPDHSKQINRIRRVIGQLEGVQRMIEAKRYCPDILTQTRAISSAVNSLESSILETHLRNCVSEAFTESEEGKEEKISELLEIFKRSR